MATHGCQLDQTNCNKLENSFSVSPADDGVALARMLCGEIAILCATNALMQLYTYQF